MATPNRPAALKRMPDGSAITVSVHEALRRGDGMIADVERPTKVKAPPKATKFGPAFVPPRSAGPSGPARGLGSQSRPGKRVDSTSDKPIAHVGGHQLGTARGNRKV